MQKTFRNKTTTRHIDSCCDQKFIAIFTINYIVVYDSDDFNRY